MDEYNVDTFANRDEPLPLLTVPYDDVDVSSDAETDSGKGSRRARIRRKLSASRLREKAEELQKVTSDKSSHNHGGRPSIQDRLFNKLLEQVIPGEDFDETEDDPKIDRRSSKYVARPAFSLGTMSTNFRRFNARIGIVFVFQNRLIRLFTWTTTTHTLSFLAVYTFVCLDPYLVIVLPLAIALLFIMVPAFIARHPPPPKAVRATQPSTDSYSGPPIAPARTIRPASETSKDFFRNMRDLQNSMADFSNAHDVLVTYIAPATNFSDEVFSSTVFVYLFLLTCVLFTSAHLLPFRLISLLGGWTLIISGHPTAQRWLIKQQKKAERKAAQYSDTLQSPTPLTPTISRTLPTGTVPTPGTATKAKAPSLYGLPIPNNATTRTLQSSITSLSEITLSSAPETAEVEIFELQHRPLLPSSYNPRTSSHITEWTPHLYAATPYDPLSPTRISGSRPVGTRFFEDVQPPPGWQFHTPKWELDLEADEWVNDRLIVGVEYDIMHHDSADLQAQRRESINLDFGGWVWDLPPPPDTKSGLERDEEVWLAYGDYNFAEDEKAKRKGKRDERTIEEKAKVKKDWEEQIRFGSRGRTGEWRRRRWVRIVRRRKVNEGEHR